MNIKHWNQSKWKQLVSSLQSHWKLDKIHTHCPLIPSNPEHPQYCSNVAPLLTKVIRKLYRIQTFGFICKVKLEFPSKRPVFTKSFIKEINIESDSNSSEIELYATMCASYLRHTQKVPGLALCYGFVSGRLKQFTTETHTSSIAQIPHPETLGFRVKRIGDTYSQIEKMNEPVYLLMQEYFPLTFDDVIVEWKTMDDSLAATHLASMLAQITSGLLHMEQEWGIHHNDLHLGNIVARKQKDGTYQWTIIDWGRATIQREGCQTMNHIFKTVCGAAYGQLKMADFPLQPNHRMQYTQAASGADLICLLISLLQETYIKILLQKLPIDDEWFPTPPIRGSGLHCFRLANKWAAEHAETLSMKQFIDTMIQ